MREFESPAFNGNGVHKGTIVHGKPQKESLIKDPILVLPNGGVQYYETIAFTARIAQQKGWDVSVILERGGPTCHIVTSMREKGIIVMHLPKALELLKEGKFAIVDASNGIISIKD